MKKLRYFIETSAVQFMAWVMPRLPRHVIMVLAKVVGTVAFAFEYRGRATALENLRVTHDGRLSWWQSLQIVRRAYQNFARTFIDLFWGSRLTHENWREHLLVEWEDPETLAIANQRGALWVTPHFGNFEFMGLLLGFLKLNCTVIAQDFKNPALTEIFKRARGVSGNVMIASQGGALRLMKSLAKKGQGAVLTDLNVKPGRAATVIECFGLKTCVTSIHATLAHRLGLVIVPLLCEPLDDGRYVMRICRPILPEDSNSPEATTQRVWDVFEPAIRAHPERWMWMYKHWRYLPGDGTDGHYPSYANRDKAFVKMIAGQPL